MSIIILSVLFVSIVLSLGRNMLSKNISDFAFGTYEFFYMQTLIFGCGCAVLICSAIIDGKGISGLTLVYALIYAVLLLAAQWCYTAALKNGNTSVCVTVYSLGFIIPTMSGCLLWGESFGVRSLLGLICVILSIIISGSTKNTDTQKNGKHIIPLVFAMLASGGLGVMQKIQQKSAFATEKSEFILAAFLIAASISFICFMISKKNAVGNTVNKAKIFSAAGAGACFGCCNLANTFLAGKLNSSFFFPVQNISVILLSLILSIPIFHERIGKKELAVLCLGGCAILLLNNG